MSLKKYGYMSLPPYQAESDRNGVTTIERHTSHGGKNAPAGAQRRRSAALRNDRPAVLSGGEPSLWGFVAGYPGLFGIDGRYAEGNFLEHIQQQPNSIQ